MTERRCSECGESLKERGPRALTCNDTCRQARSARLRKVTPLADNHRDTRERRAARKAAHDATVEVLKPVIREALTEEALRGIRELLGLTPAAVSALRDDLEGDDPVLRQRAAGIVVKYTMGNSALVQADDTDGSKQIVVNFALPRPEVLGGDRADASLGDGECEELRTCKACGSEKVGSEFAENSARCLTCHEELRQKVLGRVGGAG